MIPFRSSIYPNPIWYDTEFFSSEIFTTNFDIFNMRWWLRLWLKWNIFSKNEQLQYSMRSCNNMIRSIKRARSFPMIWWSNLPSVLTWRPCKSKDESVNKHIINYNKFILNKKNIINNWRTNWQNSRVLIPSAHRLILTRIRLTRWIYLYKWSYG